MKKGCIYNTEIGSIRIVESEKGICELSFSNIDSDLMVEETPLIQKAFQQLQEYLLGKRTTFSVPLDIQGSEFQQKTWRALLTIPYGETWSYKKLAKAVGNEKASRAVGNANNKNHIGIMIPCHRVIGSNGKLVGYAGGLDKKEYLLALEKKYK
jgi:methylated-DNA-[protein]-cysteine S-methyltransferase